MMRADRLRAFLADLLALACAMAVFLAVALEPPVERTAGAPATAGAKR